MRKYLIFARTEREANEDAIGTLEPVEWAELLLKKIVSNGGLNAPSGLLFELRFAADLQRAGGTATYEFKTGVGESSVDFLIHSSPEWLVELASAEPHRKPGEADQQLKFAGVLSDKVCDESGAAQKFPLPTNKDHSDRL